jgi:L-cysteate sulfo-lyase
LIRSIDEHPRIRLAHLPTPLEPLDRLSETLGGPRIWIKRDDCTGLGSGGNKTRKLEFLLGDARVAGADVVISFGAVQSNHARQTAAACASQGIECHLILARKVPWQDPNYEVLGNVLLDHLFGARVHLVEAADVRDTFGDLKDRLKDEGRTPYVIPTGGSNAIGALGYVQCARELIEQTRQQALPLHHIVHATSSAGTQAGLLAGLTAARKLDTTTVHGINVSEPAQDTDALRGTIAELACETLALLDVTTPLPQTAVRVDSRYIGEGYGLPTEATLAALRQVARLEGILLDPVYSAKAMSGLLGMIRAGGLRDASDVVFLHTGGSASLPVYGEVVLER